MTIARTAAAGETGLHPAVLDFSTSLWLDLKLLREDLIGSLAHSHMLAKQGLLPKEDARALHQGLTQLWDEAAKGTLTLPTEEDVHMAVEAELSKRLGEPAGRLHTARSRNDQVALDLHLHVREQCALVLEALSTWLTAIAERAAQETNTLLPAYTHRQRAQPVSVAYWLLSYGSMFSRDVQAFSFALSQVDELPLGVGAIAGSTLPVDRDHVRAALGFSRVSKNGLDTVGNRDFALDFTYACTRLMLHASRLAADVIDFSTQEFGFVKLDGEIACGSSMMPQKKNPDVFELIRGKSAKQLGNLVALLTTVKGLPGGYLRDLQEDRAPLLETGPAVLGVLSMLDLSLKRIAFDPERCRLAVENDYTQATDIAEALVKKGLPFRQAYKAAGALVKSCQAKGLPLSKATLAQARELHPAFDETVLACCDALGSPGRKVTVGSPGPDAMKLQLQQLREAAADAAKRAAQVPRLSTVFEGLRKAVP